MPRSTTLTAAAITALAACAFAAPCISSQAPDLGRTIGPGCRMSESRGIIQAGAIVAPGPATTASTPGMETSTAIPGMSARPRLPTRAGIAIAIDGRRPLAPLVAAETAAHPGLSEL